jgi:hypothetical protein
MFQIEPIYRSLQPALIVNQDKEIPGQILVREGGLDFSITLDKGYLMRCRANS